MEKIGYGNYHCIIPFSNEFHYATTCSSRWRMACYSVHKPISRNGRQLTLEPRLIDLLVFLLNTVAKYLAGMNLSIMSGKKYCHQSRCDAEYLRTT